MEPSTHNTFFQIRGFLISKIWLILSLHTLEGYVWLTLILFFLQDPMSYHLFSEVAFLAESWSSVIPSATCWALHYSTKFTMCVLLYTLNSLRDLRDAINYSLNGSGYEYIHGECIYGEYLYFHLPVPTTELTNGGSTTYHQMNKSTLKLFPLCDSVSSFKL